MMFEFEIDEASKALLEPDGPFPPVEFPQVNTTVDPRSSGNMTLSYFRIDGFARFIVHRITMTRRGPLLWTEVKVSDSSGALVKSAQISNTVFPASTDNFDGTEQMMVDSSGLAPGLYNVDYFAIYGGIGLFGGYGIFASAAQLTTEWGPTWGGIFAPQLGGEFNVRKSFFVNLT